jgi:hypothetical protein
VASVKDGEIDDGLRDRNADDVAINSVVVGVNQRLVPPQPQVVGDWFRRFGGLHRKTPVIEFLLNFRLHGASLVPETRKPFDVLVEGLVVWSSRGDRI